MQTCPVTNEKPAARCIKHRPSSTSGFFPGSFDSMVSSEQVSVAAQCVPDMSSEQVLAATTHILQFKIQWISLVVIFYDYILTFPMEVEYMWKQRFRPSSALYILCRYALLANVLYILALAEKLGTRIIGALSVLGRAAVIMTFILRTFAIFSRQIWIIFFLGSMGLACVVLDIMHLPGLKCSGPSESQLPATLLSILMAVFEFCVASFTFIRAFQSFSFGNHRKFNPEHGGLVFLMFEQGVLYFAVMSVLTIAAVLLNFLAPAGFFQRLLGAIVLPMSALLTARFILHLRAWQPSSELTAITQSAVDIPVFVYSLSGSDESFRGRDDSRGSVTSYRGSDPLLSSTRGQRGSAIISYSTISAIVDDFGHDPVQRRRRTLRDFPQDVI